jgi:hypothetical protein
VVKLQQGRKRVGIIDILEISKIGNVFGVVGKFPQWVANCGVNISVIYEI